MTASGPVRCTAMLPVSDVRRSIDFYAQLGFTLAQDYAPEGRLCWAYLQSGFADLMVTLATPEAGSGASPVLFYLYYADIVATHAALAAAGLEVGEMRHPPYCPDGEFGLRDPDGHLLMLTHR